MKPRLCGRLEMSKLGGARKKKHFLGDVSSCSAFYLFFIFVPNTWQSSALTFCLEHYSHRKINSAQLFLYSVT